MGNVGVGNVFIGSVIVGNLLHVVCQYRKCLVWEMSGMGNVLYGKCVVWENIWYGKWTCIGNVYHDKYLVGEMSGMGKIWYGKCMVWEMSVCEVYGVKKS